MVVISLLPLILMDRSKNVVDSVSDSMFHLSEPNLLICCLNVFHEESGMLVEFIVLLFSVHIPNMSSMKRSVT